MIQRIFLSMLVTLLCFSFIQAFSQQTILSAGGNSADGSISYSFGQFDFHTYFQSSSSVAQGVHIPLNRVLSRHCFHLQIR